jgi:prepilin-type N-terminal cleavage/methylation domain-containing protein
MNNYNTKLHTHSGFTLIEVMVSVSIFTIIITMGIGSLLTVHRTLQKTRADQQVLDSTSYILDTMTRRLRTGYDYKSVSQSEISFQEQDEGTGSRLIKFYTDTDPISLDNHLYIDQAGAISDITPNNLKIDNFLITLTGTIPGPDDGQPMVQISLAATMKNKQESKVYVQTAVSQRLLDFASAPATLTGSPDKSPSSLTPGATFNPNPKIEVPDNSQSTPINTSTDIKTIPAANPVR